MKLPFDTTGMDTLHRLASDSRQAMMGLHSSGPFTPLAFYIQCGEMQLQAYRTDDKGVLVACIRGW